MYADSPWVRSVDMLCVLFHHPSKVVIQHTQHMHAVISWHSEIHALVAPFVLGNYSFHISCWL
jgi:hypothetical protein